MLSSAGASLRWVHLRLTKVNRSRTNGTSLKEFCRDCGRQHTGRHSRYLGGPSRGLSEERRSCFLPVFVPRGSGPTGCGDVLRVRDGFGPYLFFTRRSGSCPLPTDHRVTPVSPLVDGDMLWDHSHSGSRPGRSHLVEVGEGHRNPSRDQGEVETETSTRKGYSSRTGYSVEFRFGC